MDDRNDRRFIAGYAGNAGQGYSKMMTLYTPPQPEDPSILNCANIEKQVIDRCEDAYKTAMKNDAVKGYERQIKDARD